MIKKLNNKIQNNDKLFDSAAIAVTEFVRVAAQHHAITADDRHITRIALNM